MIKYIIAAVIIYLIYIYLFRSKRGNVVSEDDKKSSSKTMVECNTCSVFISSDEAVIKDGKYYCSKKCMGV